MTCITYPQLAVSLLLKKGLLKGMGPQPKNNFSGPFPNKQNGQQWPRKLPQKGAHNEHPNKSETISCSSFTKLVVFQQRSCSPGFLVIVTGSGSRNSVYHSRPPPITTLLEPKSTLSLCDMEGPFSFDLEGPFCNIVRWRGFPCKEPFGNSFPIKN